MSELLLQIDHLSKAFGALVATDDDDTVLAVHARCKRGAQKAAPWTRVDIAQLSAEQSNLIRCLRWLAHALAGRCSQ